MDLETFWFCLIALLWGERLVQLYQAWFFR